MTWVPLASRHHRRPEHRRNLCVGGYGLSGRRFCDSGSPAPTSPGSRHRSLSATVARAEGGQCRPCPSARSRRTGERPAQVLAGPAEDPQLPARGDRPGQGCDGADPDRLRSSWKELSADPEGVHPCGRARIGRCRGRQWPPRDCRWRRECADDGVVRALRSGPRSPLTTTKRWSSSPPRAPTSVARHLPTVGAGPR